MAAIDNTQNPAMAQEGALTRFLRATEIDSRMLGMVGALLVIWIGFDIASAFIRGGDGVFGGNFLTPRNLWILLVQTSSIAVMTTGMVLIIVMRHIDLSVGSVLGFTAVCIGTMQVYWLGPMLGVGHPAIWIISLVLGLALGAAMRSTGTSPAQQRLPGEDGWRWRWPGVVARISGLVELCL